jgi:hypothetical protein
LKPSSARLAIVLACLVLPLAPRAASAQVVEIAPFVGYRTGGYLYEVVTGTALDVNGASAGVNVDLFVREGTSVTFLYSRQEAGVEVRGTGGSTVTFGKVPIEHWHVGGGQELNGGRIRALLAGTVGLTRFGGRESEVRFSAAGDAGVKLIPSDHFGARLDARLYAVFVDGGIGRVACGNGFCAFAVDALIAWQGEFTAAFLISF